MRSASQLIHQHLGTPTAKDCHPIPPNSGCWICGGKGYPRGTDATKFTSSSMTDQNQCRDPSAEFVCEACVWIRSRTSPVPGRLPGPCSACKGVKPEMCPKCEGTGRNSSGGNWRNYSALFDANSNTPLVTASKGEKPTIISFLRSKKHGVWFAAIADSGQKQVIPYTPVNAPNSRGRVLFDEVIVVLPDERGWRLADDMRDLLTVGATKEEIASGNYGAGAWSRCRSVIEAFELAWSRHRHGSFFSLALWLSQRDEDAVQARIAQEKALTTELKSKPKKGPKNGTDKGTTGKTKNADRRGDSVISTAISGERVISSDALGCASESSTIGSTTDGNDRSLDVDVPEKLATSSAGQLGLFGDSGSDDVRPRTRKRR